VGRLGGGGAAAGHTGARDDLGEAIRRETLDELEDHILDEVDEEKEEKGGEVHAR
jgi:hypothetical protein